MSRAGLTARVALQLLNSDSPSGGGSDPNGDPNPSPTAVVAAAFADLGLMHVILFGAVVDRPAELGAARSNAGWITA